MPNNSNAIVRTCPLYWESLAHHSRLVPRIAEFVKFKAANPFSNFGSRDTHAHHGFGELKVRHAHLTSDISIWYRVHGKNPTLIDLYGLYSHDDSGTGQPANIRRQKNFIQRMSNTSFEPSDISEAQQILTAETRQQAYKWLKGGFGKDPHAALKSLVNHAIKDANALSLLTHLREAQQQMQRLATTVTIIDDPELQNSLSRSVNQLAEQISQMLPRCLAAATQGDINSFAQLHQQYKDAVYQLVHDFIHDLRSVFKSS